MQITICHLYPELLNLYGDTGNILALKRRCSWRDIKVNIKIYDIGHDVDFDDVDIFFIGGGADKDQNIVSVDISKIKEPLKEAIDAGKVVLAINGGYQMLGRYHEQKDNTEQGLGILDFYTKSAKKSLVGNILVKTEGEDPYTLIGFENHSGRTFLQNGLKPLGRVLVGFGNNGRDKTEGVKYKNVFGTYMHGPLLPKNPKFCDELISIALENRYGKSVLKELDDTLEKTARKAMLERFGSRYTVFR